jgi:hypothetical protein
MIGAKKRMVEYYEHKLKRRHLGQHNIDKEEMMEGSIYKYI